MLGKISRHPSKKKKEKERRNFEFATGMAKKLETLLEFERESQSIVAASWKLGIFKDIPGRFTGVYEAYPI